MQGGKAEKFGTNRAWEWLRDGGEFEDVPAWYLLYLRSFNHFHDPLTNAGFGGVWRSSIEWGLLPPGTQSPGGYYSWSDVRGYFFGALTAQGDAAREQGFAETFRGVGQLMHLVQDASVPAHTRNDAHVLYNYESYVSDPRKVDITTAGAVSPGGPLPLATLIDANGYVNPTPDPGITTSAGIGLSEYTQANFFSEDTINVSAYPFPRITPATPVVLRNILAPDGTTYKREYWLKDCCGETNGGQGYLLSAVDWLDYYRLKYPLLAGVLPKIPVLDDNVYKDYSFLLLPRAIGYSASLLQYFFRIELEVSEVEPKKDQDGNVTEVALRVKNATQTGESLSGGRFWLNARFKLPDTTEYTYRLSDEVLSGDIPAGNDPKDDAFKYAFPYSDYIPKDATNVQYTLAYRGPTKNAAGQITEPDAVAGVVERKDEPVLLVWAENDPDLLGFDANLNQVKVNEADYIKVSGLYPNRLEKLGDPRTVIGWGGSLAEPAYYGGWGLVDKGKDVAPDYYVHTGGWGQRDDFGLPSYYAETKRVGFGNVDLRAAAYQVHPEPPLVIYAKPPPSVGLGRNLVWIYRWQDTLPWVGYTSTDIVAPDGSSHGGLFSDWGTWRKYISYREIPNPYGPGVIWDAYLYEDYFEADYFEVSVGGDLTYSEEPFSALPKKKVWDVVDSDTDTWTHSEQFMNSAVVINGKLRGYVKTVYELVQTGASMTGSGSVDLVFDGGTLASMPFRRWGSIDWDTQKTGEIYVRAVASGNGPGTWGIVYEKYEKQVSGSALGGETTYSKTRTWMLRLNDGTEIELGSYKATNTWHWVHAPSPWTGYAIWWPKSVKKETSGNLVSGICLSVSPTGEYFLASHVKRPYNESITLEGTDTGWVPYWHGTEWPWPVDPSEGAWSLAEYVIDMYKENGTVLHSPLPESEHLKRLAAGRLVHGWRRTLAR